MPFKIPDFTANAKGGTELQTQRLIKSLELFAPELLDFFNFYPSRVRDFNSEKPSVYIPHDLSTDPETEHLRNNGYLKFDIIAFVSNWQYQQFQHRYSLSGDNCVVINNGIEPIVFDPMKWSELLPIGTKENPLRLIYHPSPNRGLEILIPAFDTVYQKLKSQDIHCVLDVYSSFNIYGWPERDQFFSGLFEYCKTHPAINYHGSVSNAEIRDALALSHIFAYPSIWPETSCLALIEAMSAGCVCVHSNLGALIETSGLETICYPFKSFSDSHCEYFTNVLMRECLNITTNKDFVFDYTAVERVNNHYNWNNIQHTWIKMLSDCKKQLS